MKGLLSRLIISDKGFFSILFLYTLFVFRKAFEIKFFQDDFFFLKISRANNISDFLHFFSPFREYSYKPLATEVFYSLLHTLNENYFLGHIIMFGVFFIGLYFLHQSISLITKNKIISRLVVFLYATSLSHVFQLYWFATFQEIVVFASLTSSFYFFMKNKTFLSYFLFVLGLLSKETAVLFSPFLVLYSFIFLKIKEKIKPLLVFIFLSIFFYLIYKYSLQYVTSLDNYKIQFNPKLLLNNSAWYFLWSLGFPNSLPGYFSSLLLKPLPIFWDLFKITQFKIYFSLLLIYLLTFFTTSIYFAIKTKQINKYAYSLLASIIFFFLFLGPILFFPHKWMIRLTMPLIFISIFQAFWVEKMLKDKLLKYVAIFLLGIYLLFNFFGIAFNESSGLFLLETRIYNNANDYFSKHKDEIKNHKYIYFEDEDKYKNDIFKTSKMVQQTFADQSFMDHFFPGSNLTAVYNFRTKKIPNDSYVIKSIDILSTD